MLRVVLSESRPLTRQGLLAVLARDDGVGVLATAATLREALALDARHLPDVHLVGAWLPPAGGAEAARLLVRGRPDAAILIVAAEEPDDRAVVGPADRARLDCAAYRALLAGARGYLDADAEPPETLRAVREVAAGRPYLAGPSLAAVLTEMRRLAARRAPLPPALQATLELLRRGLSNKEIAAALGVSLSTVKRWIRELEGLFGVRGRTLLAVHAVAAAPTPVLTDGGEQPLA
jgi:DNA-binding NarL/FixJ family response regulator